MMSTTRRKKEREASINSLPNEVLFDMLVRFPADFLHHKARLVCCRWCHIIRSDAFINTHFQQHSTYGLVWSLAPVYKPCHSIYMTATQGGRIETSELSNISMASSCNGLTLKLPETVASGELHVVNPATKQSFRLPSVSTQDRYVYYRLCGIAYSVASMEYKVTLPWYSDHSPSAFGFDIVSVGVDKSWRRVEHSSLPEGVKPLFFSYPALTTEGFLHWGKELDCWTMNVDTEMITKVEAPIPPNQRYHYSYYYLSTGRYITLLANRHKELWWELWEMRPAENGEWRKAVLPNIDLEPQKSKLQQFGYDDYEHDLEPIGWVKYPEILAFSCRASWGSGRTCIVYNLEKHEINAINLPDDLWKYGRAFVHRNTLAWLSQDRRE